MARLPQGILGGISGKIGNVVGSSWKGIAIVKSKPLSVSNPRTSGQIAQRTKLANIVAFSKLILASVIKPLWDRFAQQASGYNEFVSENIDLFSSEMPSIASDLVISKGKMVAVTPVIGSLSDGDTAVPVSYSSALPDNLSLPTDSVYAVAVNANQAIVGVSSGVATRQAAAVNIPLNQMVVTDNVVNVYLAFRRADGTIVSNTGFATKVVD